MFIASSTTKDRAPIGGKGDSAYIHFTSTGLPLGDMTSLVFATTSKNLRRKNKVWLRTTARSRSQPKTIHEITRRNTTQFELVRVPRSCGFVDRLPQEKACSKTIRPLYYSAAVRLDKTVSRKDANVQRRKLPSDLLIRVFAPLRLCVKILAKTKTRFCTLVTR